MKKVMLGATAKLMVVDDLSPEDSAMLQALYSRSAESAETHIEKVKASGSGKFMSSFYVGYGHKSIADCGSTTMFIENVSLLAAKAIQDWPLYSGQETSTRYIDMSKQRIEDPVNSATSKEVLRRWMAFYTESHSPVALHIMKRYPKKQDEDEGVYMRAVKARTFDILRGFLPAGITTQLSWHTNIRQAGDHLNGLTKHPAAEVRGIGEGLRRLLAEQYPSSGAGLNLASVSGVGIAKDVTEAAIGATKRMRWEEKVADEDTYFVSAETEAAMRMNSSLVFNDEDEMHLIRTRPKGCVLPHSMSRFGHLNFSFDLDFGSFRDLQRHRNGVCRMPLLTMDHGFEEWYLQELGDLADEARKLIAIQESDIESLPADPVVRQYYMALGFRVPCRVSYGLPAAIYVMELRSGKMIHPTLRRRIHEMIAKVRAAYPFLPLHVDMDRDDWDVRRGQQTIESREGGQ